MEIRNQHILITGYTRGIGLVFANKCAELGAHLHLLSRSKVEGIAELLKNKGAESVSIYETDLSEFKQIKDFFNHIDKENIQIDILFNNAGLLTGGLIENQNMDEVYSMIQVNVTALIHMTNGVLPRMLKRKKGKIVNHSSVSGYLYTPCSSTYAASKAAVIAFTNAVRLELKDTGVTTLLLLTPGVKTSMFDKIVDIYSKNMEGSLSSENPEQYVEKIIQAIIDDKTVLNPDGISRKLVFYAKYLPQIWEKNVLKNYHR